MFRSGKWPLLIAILAAAAAAAGYLVWTTRRTLDQTAAQVRHEHEIRFTDRPFDHPAPPGAESIASAASFRDAAVYQGKLWLLSPDALWEFSPEGRPIRRYQTGIDLPPAPLAKLTTATIAAAGEPQLCIATQGAGLITYNGRTFRQILPQLPAQRKLTALLSLSSGDLLLGTEKAGLLAWDGRTLRSYHDGLANLSITALAGQLDNLWIGTLDKGAFLLHGGEIFSFDEKLRLPDAHVLSVAVLEDRSFVGTSAGIAEFRAGKLERVLAEGTFSRALHPLPGLLLVGTLEEGIVEVPLAVRQPRPRQALTGPQNRSGVSTFLSSGSTVYAVLQDRVLARTALPTAAPAVPDGSGESVGGSPESENTGWRTVIKTGLSESPTLTDHNIAALAVEDSGKLWVGYFDRGLDVLTLSSSLSIRDAIHHEDDHLFCINRILPTKDGAVIATANGLVFTDTSGTPRRIMGRNEGLISNHVTGILHDNANNLIAATPAGITFLGPGAPQSITAFHGLVNNHVYALASSGTRLMAGTLGGISVVDNGIVKSSYSTSNSALRHNWITALIQTGNEWFAGTYGAGVFRLDGSQWQGFPDLGQGLEVNPNAMFATQSAIYAGTLTRGLAMYNRSSGRWAFQTAGLPSTNVTALTAANGFLYVGTDNGVVRFAERTLPLP